MVITYYGKQYCKLTLGDLTIAINPPSKISKVMPKPPRFGADIVLITTNHPDYNGVETVTLGDKEPFVIDGPGNYEVKECFINGAKSTVVLDGNEYINTVYGFELDGIKVVIMGALSDISTLSVEGKEIAGAADMLFIPIEGGDVFDSTKAYKVATTFSPSIIIPLASDEALITRLLKEAGQEKSEMLDKATLKRRDLEGKESFVIALSPQA
jgi:L-ascorbate metabolism protein UlaG (beta-lactamase superfamily)